MKKKILIYINCLLILFTTGCIENDLPYPTIIGLIRDFETEGFVSATINNNTYEATIWVEDTVDLRNIQVTKLVTNAESAIIPDAAACIDAANFPDSSFVSVDSLPSHVNTYMNLSNPVNFTLRTYQDYVWKVTTKHAINRSFRITDADGRTIQIGQPTVDEENKLIIIYVEEGTDITKILVEKMQIGSSVAVTTPEPTGLKNFHTPLQFEVTAFDVTETWTVIVTPSLVRGITLSPWARRAYILGEGNENTNILLQYRQKGDEEWDRVYSDEITYEDGNFTALIRHLKPSTTYEYQATIGSQQFDINEFTTESLLTLPNGGFEDWFLSDKTWLILKEGDDMFWDSGNHGSVTVGRNVTTYDESIYYSGRRSAKLASQHVVAKFAAGNLFAGEYIETDQLDGILDFGRPFTGRPTALKGAFRYICTPISHTSDVEIEDGQLGMNDKAHIYVAVGDWSSPVRIRTKASERKLFDVDDENIIAYQELIVDQTVNEWTEFRLNLDYRSFTRVPTYLVIVSTASKYGDYFTGGEGSTLWLDDFELIYE